MVRKRVLITATIAILCMIFALFIVQPMINARDENVEKVKETDTFPRNLVLRGTKADTYKYPYVRHLLVDEDTVYPNPAQKDSAYADRYDSDDGSMNLDHFVRTMYNKSFVYTKLPQKEYYIIGMPSVSLTFEVGVDGQGHIKGFELWFIVSLWRISPGGTWDQVIDFGTAYWDVSVGPPTYEFDYDGGLWFSQSVADPVWIGPHEKIALRIVVSGRSLSGLYVDLTHSYKMAMNNQFVVDLPIVET